MAQHSIIENIHRNTEDWFAVKEAVRGKGVDCPDDTPTADVAGKIEDIQSGGVEYSTSYRVTQNKLNSADVEITQGEITLSLPDGITEIRGCRPIIPFTVVINSNITTIGGFSDSGVEKINIPPSVTTFASQAFYNCQKLKEINIPVERLYQGTFSGCESLETIYISKKLIDIWGDAFLNCGSLKDVYYEGTQEEWQQINGYENVPSRATIHYNYVPE